MCVYVCARTRKRAPHLPYPFTYGWTLRLASAIMLHICARVQISFSISGFGALGGKYSEMKLLDHIAVLFLIFSGTATLFSM